MSYIIKSSFLFALATILISCKDKKEESTSSSDETVSVRIAEIQSQNAAEAVVASGIIASSNEARLAFKTGGIIAAIFVKEGDQVKKGQILAILDSRDRLQAELEQAKEQVLINQARLAQVKAGAKTGEITAEIAKSQLR